MESPYRLMQQLEAQIRARLSDIDIYDLEMDVRKLVLALRNQATDARLDIRDYELSETRQLQIEKATAAHDRLKQLEKDILTVSEYNIFSSVDVAHLSAKVEYILEKLL